MLEKISQQNKVHSLFLQVICKAMLKNMIQSLEEEEKAMEKEFVTPRKDKCLKSSKIKPLMKESVVSDNIQKNNGANNQKIKKSGKTEPAVQKKVKTGMESLEQLVKDEEEKLSKKQVIHQMDANGDNENNEEQLKSLLEKSILQKRGQDNHITVVDTQVQIQGSFEAYDVPARIIEGKIQRQIDNKYMLKCVLEWKQRPNGVQPIKSCYDNMELRKYCPLLLIDFYESKIIPKSEIEQQQQSQQQVVKQKELKEVNNVIQVKQKYEGKYEIKGKGKEIEIESVISISSHESIDDEEEKNPDKNNEEQIMIVSEKAMTIETVSSAQIQRNKLMEQINQQEQTENEKQRKKLLEIMKAQNEKQQQQQQQQQQQSQEETEVQKYKRQLMEVMKQQESQLEQSQPVQNLEEKESDNLKEQLIEKIRIQSLQQKDVQSESSKQNVEEEKQSENEKQKRRLLELMNQQEEEMQKEDQEIEAELKPSSIIQQLQDMVNTKSNNLQNEVESKEQKPIEEIQIEPSTQQQENIEVIEEQPPTEQKEASIHTPQDSNNAAQPNPIESSQSNLQQQIETNNAQELLVNEVEKDSDYILVQKEVVQAQYQHHQSPNQSNNGSVNGTQDDLLLSLLNKNIEQVDTTSEVSSNKILAMEKALQQQMELEN